METLLAYLPTAEAHFPWIAIGIGLSACCGLRAFLPLLFVNLLSQADALDLGASFEFLGHWSATLVFGVAAITEWLGDKFPGVDHILDMMGMVLRPTAATLTAASVVHWMDPLAAFVFGLMAGGMTASVVQIAKAKARVFTSALTAGMGNTAISFLEDGVALAAAFLSIFLPLFLLGILAVSLILITIFFYSQKNKASFSR